VGRAHPFFALRRFFSSSAAIASMSIPLSFVDLASANYSPLTIA